MMAANAARKMNLMVFLRGSRPAASRFMELFDHLGCRALIACSRRAQRWTSLLGKIILDFVIRSMRKTDRNDQCLTHGTELNCDCCGTDWLGEHLPVANARSAASGVSFRSQWLWLDRGDGPFETQGLPEFCHTSRHTGVAGGRGPAFVGSPLDGTAELMVMNCVGCGCAAVTERPDLTAQGYRRFRCRACGTAVQRAQRRCPQSRVAAERHHRVRGVLPAALQADTAGSQRDHALARVHRQS